MDELIPGAVSLTRGFSQWLYNPDAGDQGPGPNTPTDTEWAFGSLDNYAGLSYLPFASYRNGDFSDVLVGNPLVVHLIKEDTYLSLTFSAWPQHGGSIAYTRSTPLVAITNPISNLVLAAPANVTIGAFASTVNGPITNVAFFTNGILLGAVHSAPFTISPGNFTAGSFALTAVATAGGIATTSSPIFLTVVSPMAIALSAPGITNGQFGFDYSADPGLNYVVQSSSNLKNWQSLVTNVATGNPMTFSTNFTTDAALYYRVGRLPNP